METIVQVVFKKGGKFYNYRCHCEVQVGDVVVLPTMGFTKLEHDGEEFFVGPEQQILAKIKQ